MKSDTPNSKPTTTYQIKQTNKPNKTSECLIKNSFSRSSVAGIRFISHWRTNSRTEVNWLNWTNQISRGRIPKAGPFVKEKHANFTWQKLLIGYNSINTCTCTHKQQQQQQQHTHTNTHTHTHTHTHIYIYIYIYTFFTDEAVRIFVLAKGTPHGLPTEVSWNSSKHNYVV